MLTSSREMALKLVSRLRNPGKGWRIISIGTRPRRLKGLNSFLSEAMQSENVTVLGLSVCRLLLTQHVVDSTRFEGYFSLDDSKLQSIKSRVAFSTPR